MPEPLNKKPMGVSSDLRQKCAAQHFGLWMIEPDWFARAFAAIKAGTFQAAKNTPVYDEPEDPYDEPRKIYEITPDGIAIVPMFGQMTKEDSSFGGVNSVRTRKAIRDAADDSRVNAILLQIDSPGGTCAGTGDLADDVWRINSKAADDGGKPVYAYCEDLTASAAYWVASQCRHVFANPTAQIGSIGTMTWVEDTSGQKAMEGVKVYLISTGKFKGAWLDGVPVSDEYLKELRTEVEDLNEHFLTGVMRGRPNLDRDELSNVADGRVFIASKAQQLGLIDEVASIDAAITAITQEVNMTLEQFNKFAAENPDAVKKLEQVQKIEAEAVERTKTALKPKNATASELKAAFPNDTDFVMDRLDVDAPMADHKLAFADHVQAKLAKEQQRADEAERKLADVDPALAGTKPVNTRPKSPAGDKADDTPMTAEREKQLMAY